MDLYASSQSLMVYHLLGRGQKYVIQKCTAASKPGTSTLPPQIGKPKTALNILMLCCGKCIANKYDYLTLL